MITESIQQNHTDTKYYQFATILEHVIDCFHTIVTDETNPYHPPLGWLTRRQPKPPDEELFSDLMDECSLVRQQAQHQSTEVTFSQSSSSIGNSSNSSSPSSSLSSSYSQSPNKIANNHSVQLSSSVRSRLEKCSEELRREIVSREREGCSPLFVASQNGLIKVVSYLLDICGANIEQKGHYETLEDRHIHLAPPIWVAAISGHYDTVELLIERGANVNSLSDTGSTPLRSVCFLCKDDDGESKSGIPELRGQRHSNASSSSSRRPIDIFSIDQHCDMDESEDEDEQSGEDDPYMGIVQLLVESGADVSKSNYNGSTCLMNSLHNYRLTDYILSHGADVNASDNIGRTALHYAVYGNRLNVAKLLLLHGADPRLRTNFCDDALQLCCIEGHEEIFAYLIANNTYTVNRLADAYKLLGCSILEKHCDISRVRSLWLKSLRLQQPQASNQPETNISQIESTLQSQTASDITLRRRSIAFGANACEFTTEQELDMLSGEDFRIQSLLISERVLGPTHDETIQRLLHHGNSYLNSMRPDRCVDLWIYALVRLLDHNLIFNFETFLGVRRIKKLLSELVGQQPQMVRFDDIYDMLDSLISHDRMLQCVQLFNLRPRSCLHEDFFNTLLECIVSLLLFARCVARDTQDWLKIDHLVAELVRVNPRASDGSSLLHVCATSALFEGAAYRSMLQLMNSRLWQDSQCSSSDIHSDSCAPVLELMKQLLDAGLEVDQLDENQMSALQKFCLASSSIRAQEKWKIIKLLVDRGAHVDRRTMTQEQSEWIKLAMRESNVDQFSSIRLSCLAARQLSKQLRYPTRADSLASEIIKLSLTRSLRELVEMH